MPCWTSYRRRGARAGCHSCPRRLRPASAGCGRAASANRQDRHRPQRQRKMLKAGFDVASQVWLSRSGLSRPWTQEAGDGPARLSEELINEISARARADAVRNSQQEVKRMEDLLRSHRGALRSFRDTQQEFDPTKQAEARYSLLGKLEEALSQAKTKLGNLRSFMGKDAPSVLVLNSEIASLERQVIEERAKLGKDEATSTRGRETLGGLVPTTRSAGRSRICRKGLCFRPCPRSSGRASKPIDSNAMWRRLCGPLYRKRLSIPGASWHALRCLRFPWCSGRLAY